MSFYEIVNSYNKFNFDEIINSATSKQIEAIINKSDKTAISESEFLRLLSNQAVSNLEAMAVKARDISINHFGKSITLFAPLYVSNFCINNCIYCGFSTRNNIERKVLSFDEIKENAEKISSFGIRQILLLTGESAVKTDMKYLEKAVCILRDYFDVIDIEIYPLSQEGYEELFRAGVSGMTVFQETYDENLYKQLHTKGQKANYRFRLETPERAGHAGYRNLSIGALLGLGDFIKEVFFTGLHARYLQEAFPGADISVSFPRLRNATGGYQPNVIITDKMLVQAICAMRLFINRVGITISTRESNTLRKNLIGLGITRMSAASNTQVGGYAKKDNTKGQFDISDNSSVEQVKDMIYQKGYQPVLKDWMII
jgi:2-iminoacetate synthase